MNSPRSGVLKLVTLTSHLWSTAMFWLAQSEDERVVSFFEEILLHPIR